MKARDKHRKRWEEFAEVLKTNVRPNTFDAAWDVLTDKFDYDETIKPNKKEKMCGFYHSEAKAVWKILERENIKTLVEIGRYFGGSLFLWGCACKQLQKVWSYDIESYEVTDDILGEWFSHHKIENEILVQDSKTIEPRGLYDFVLIDGEHTGAGVKADIEVWQNQCRIISFHDFADRGCCSAHKAVYPDVIEEIKIARSKYGWRQLLPRGRSDVTFATKHYNKRI